MNKLKILGAVVIFLSAATVLYLVKPLGARGTDPQTITVTITPNEDPTGPPSVSPDPVDVSQNQEVEWICSNGCDFTVAFTESNRKPFSNRIFGKANPKSGLPSGPPGTYKYSVVVGQGSVDPQIIIH